MKKIVIPTDKRFLIIFAPNKGVTKGEYDRLRGVLRDATYMQRDPRYLVMESDNWDVKIIEYKDNESCLK